MPPRLAALVRPLVTGGIIYLVVSVGALIVAHLVPFALAWSAGFIGVLVAGREPSALPAALDPVAWRIGLGVVGSLFAVWLAARRAARRVAEHSIRSVQDAAYGVAAVVLLLELPHLVAPNRWPWWIRVARAAGALPEEWAFALVQLQVRVWPLAICMALVLPICLWAARARVRGEGSRHGRAAQPLAG